jgi:hypothetical protein
VIDKEALKRFVKETLGCNCPEDVFQNIDCRSNVDLGDNTHLDYEINIGDRLLVYVERIDAIDSVAPVLSRLVRSGVSKRNKHNFNRFRIVLLSQKPTDVAKTASEVFHSLGPDEKTHLHVVAEEDFPVSK